MERGSREARRSTSNGLIRRRQRATEEDLQLELRERVNRKDLKKRRKGGEESEEDETEEEEEEEEKEDDGGVNRLNVNTTSFSSSNHRRSFSPTQLSSWKVTEEVVGVPVPKKARSAFPKRRHEAWYSNCFLKEKTKTNGLKNRLPTPQPVLKSSSSSSVQEDLEIEVAEVLYGLMKQSQCSKSEASKDLCSSGHDLKFGSVENKKTSPSNSVPNGSADVEESEKKIEIYSSNAEKRSDEKIVCSSSSSKDSESVLMEVDVKNVNDKALNKETTLSPNRESTSCENLKANPEDSAPTKEKLVTPDVVFSKEEKFEIDLMAPPPMASSPERNGLTELTLDPKILAQDVEMKAENVGLTNTMDQMSVKKNDVAASFKGKVEMDQMSVKKDDVEASFKGKVETSKEKGESPKPVDLMMHDQSNGNSGSSKLQEHVHKQQEQPKCAFFSGEKKAQSSILPMSMTLPSWPCGIPPVGLMPPLPAILSTDGSTGSSATLWPRQFPPTQPRPKRCAMHQYIARNIHCHQQLTKMNNYWPAAVAAGSSPAYGAKPYNVNIMPSSDNIISWQGKYPSGYISTPLDNKGHAAAAASFQGHAGKDKSSEDANLDTAQRKQFTFQQPPQPAPAGNLLHGPAFIFPLGQHQAAMVAPPAQYGTHKPVNAAGGGTTPSVANSANGAPVSTSSMPAVAAAFSFNCPNLPGNEAPYLAALQNNSYPFTISTNVGKPPAFRGGSPARGMPFFSGTFYPSQILHPSAVQHQQPHSQLVVQPAHQSTSTSSGSSSSHKQQQGQQHPGGQISSNVFLSSNNLQLQSQQKQQVPNQSRKSGTEIGGEENRVSQACKSVYSQNFALPVQQMNFAFMPPATLGGVSGANHGEKQHQQMVIKNGVDLIPPRAFAMSFGSLNGTGTASGFNFTMGPNPIIFQSLPEVAHHGYQIAPIVQAAQSTQQKTYQNSEGKASGDLINADDGRKAISSRSSTGIGQFLAFSKPDNADPSASKIIGSTLFDGSTRTLNFISPSAPANRSTRPASSGPVPLNSTHSQQQLIQLQKQHMNMMQQQLQHELTGTTQAKAPTTNLPSAASVAGKFANNPAVLSQAFVQANVSAQSSQWMNSARIPVSQIPSQPPSASTPSAHKNLPQQQSRISQGQTQISFAVDPKPVAVSHGQHLPISNQSISLVSGAPSNSSVSKSSSGTLRVTSTGSKACPSVSPLSPQQTDNSSTTPNQKSTPVCGRNVPSILSTCPSHLSELKY